MRSSRPGRSAGWLRAVQGGEQDTRSISPINQFTSISPVYFIPYSIHNLSVESRTTNLRYMLRFRNKLPIYDAMSTRQEEKRTNDTLRSVAMITINHLDFGSQKIPVLTAISGHCLFFVVERVFILFSILYWLKA